MGGLWLASLMAGAESVQKCETSPASEIMSLEGHTANRITFGDDSRAALMIGKDVAAEYPGVQGHEADDVLPGEPCGELGAGRPGFEVSDRRRSFARVTVASAAKNLLSVRSFLKTGHEVVFSRSGI